MTSVLCFGLFLALSGLISYEDWTTRKIRNRHILVGLGLCLAGSALLLTNSVLGAHRLRFWLLGEYYLPLRYYPHLAAHVALSLTAGFALWRASIWPAGDAKFFAVASFFVALIDPNLPGFPWLLFLLLLINVFVPAGVLFALETCVLLAARAAAASPADWRVGLKAAAERAAIRLREAWPYRREYAVLAANLFLFFLLFQSLAPRLVAGLREPWRSLGLFAVMFVAWDRLVTALRDRRFGGLLLLLVLPAALALGWSPWQAARMTLGFGLLLGLGRLALDWVVERESRRDLRCEELAAGAILSDESWSRLSAEESLSGRLGRRVPDGLSGAEAEAVRQWLRLRGEKGHSVYRTIPFAFWILLGSLLTLTLRASVVARGAAVLDRLKEAL